MSAPARVLVIGAGPAGLAAGVRLLERARGRVSVTLAHQGHHLGGKAASYTDAAGRRLEHGWHMMLGFYERLFGLMDRAGASRARAVMSMFGKSHAFEPGVGKVFTLDSTGGRITTAFNFARYEGIPLDDRAHYSRFMSQVYGRILGGEELTQHDDLCFTRWAIEQGLRPHLTRYSLFRIFRDGYFNFPEQVSAYHVLRTMKLMSTSEGAEAFAAVGPYSERVWAPIGRYFESLGGVVEPYVMVRALGYEGRRVTRLHVARPAGSGHDEGASSWKTARLPVEPGTERELGGFDAVIAAIPQAVFVTLNEGDQRMWRSPYFARMQNLRSVSTMSMTVRTRDPVLPYVGPVHGLPAPLGIAVNMTRYLDRYRSGEERGHEVQLVGQEAGFESWSDDAVASFTLDQLARVPGGDLRAATITYLELHRNRADFERIFVCEPGVQRFRPGPLTPFDNLFVAGDWVKNDVDVVCMEGAVASGYDAADQLLARLPALTATDTPASAP